MNIILREARIKKFFVRVGDLVWREWGPQRNIVWVITRVTKDSCSDLVFDLFPARDPGLTPWFGVKGPWLTHLVPEEMR